MEGMASLWGYQESIDDLKHQLLCTTLELELTRTNAKEEIRRKEDNVKQLLQLLTTTCRERDEARDQFHMLLNKITQLSPINICPALSYLPPESPLIRPTGGNSSITESDSLSETHNQLSYVSSPVESFFETVSSPDLSNINMADSSNIAVAQQPFLPEYNSSVPMGFSSGTAMFDPASVIIDRLVTKKSLPEKGKLLQAVMEAGPLLQTLLVAGPLPRWRNPPLLQPFQIPPVAVKGRESESLDQRTIANPNYLVQISANAFRREDTHSAPQIYSASQLNSSSVAAGLCTRKRPMLSTCSSSYQGPPYWETTEVSMKP